MEIQYTRRLQKIEAVLETWLPKTLDSAWLEKVFGPLMPEASPATLELAESLARPLRDLLGRGGKRWRPLLMMLVAESIAGDSGAETALPLVPLVEFPHNASLIHDDIEDNSDERRGKPAVHLLYGTDTAINAGAFMYFLPLACLAGESSSDWKPEMENRIWAAWASHMRALHLGQAMDIAWHRDFHSLPALDDYDRMCRLKTGCLARLAAVLGVYCAEAIPGERQETGNFNELADVFGKAAAQLGVGFQILDDVRNLEGGITGKKRGDDIVEGKKSLPVLLYLHRYPEKRDFAAHCFAGAREQGVKAPELEEFIGELEGAGVLEEARAKGLEYIEESRKVFSLNTISGFSFKKDRQELLSKLIDLL